MAAKLYYARMTDEMKENRKKLVKIAETMSEEMI